MNEAKSHLDAGRLNEAVQSALSIVKSSPSNVAARTFLFELSCFSGDWERAEKQIDMIGHQDSKAAMSSLIYRQNFGVERDRMKFFSDGEKPAAAIPPPAYVEDLIRANDLIRDGKTADARQLLDKVEEKRPASPCTVNGEDFGDFRDYNDSTMCVFEVIIKDSYVWLPFEQVVTIKFFERKSLRDVFWPQAEVELTDGTNGEMFVPSLYANSWRHQDDLVRLGRTVDWRDVGDDIYIGEGSKLFAMDGTDKSILDIKTIEFKHS